jgi:MoaA/NifB/PqqE/SkfB family radical SAM enzyme
MFVSYDGKVQASGYLPLEAGNVRRDRPIEIYNNSALFHSLRRREDYHGSELLCPHQSLKTFGSKSLKCLIN